MIRIYVDTSVFGGTDDVEFDEPSRRFFEHVEKRRFVLLISQIILDELQPAPSAVRQVLDSLPAECIERVDVNEEVMALADAYIAANALAEGSREDATHVAAATVARANLVLSWNFKHIVNYQRIQKFNSVNLANNYGLIDIRSPLEIDYDIED